MVNQVVQIPHGAELVAVSFSAEINPHTAESLIAVMSTCANQGVQKVNLVLSTPGGAVMSGMNLYNVLRGFPFELTTHNAGNVDSIGNVVFLAGARRIACQNATFMFHGVGFDIQNARLEERALRERMDTVLNDQRRIAAVFAEQTNLGADEVETFFREQQTKDATYAVGCGIIHEVADVQIPRGTPVVSLVFQR